MTQVDVNFAASDIFNKAALDGAKECIVVCNFRGFRFEGETYTADSLDDMESMRRDMLKVSASGYSPVAFKKRMMDIAGKREQDIILSTGVFFVMTGDQEVLDKFQSRNGTIFNSFLEDPKNVERYFADEFAKPANQEYAAPLEQHMNG